MQRSSNIYKAAFASLILIFLVILAGSVVRMTGSGMGCPDWPKCFGHFIPPTNVEELTYAEGKFFEKGKMVIMNDQLWLAKEDINASGDFQSENWEAYTVHDYAIYNPMHTWIEYINRLFGALSGIPVLILFVLTFIGFLKRKDLLTFILAALTLFMLGFEAWLGKTVVDANLAVVKITLHMLGSMALVALLLLILFRHREQKFEFRIQSTFWKIMSVVIVLIALVQVILGTQVREEIDVIAKVSENRSTWIESLTSIFKVHRSFSILVTLLLIWMFVRSKGLVKVPRALKGIFWIAALEIIVGVILAYANVPAPAQPIHLLLAIFWFACGWYFLLQVWSPLKVS